MDGVSNRDPVGCGRWLHQETSSSPERREDAKTSINADACKEKAERKHSFRGREVGWDQGSGWCWPEPRLALRREGCLA